MSLNSIDIYPKKTGFMHTVCFHLDKSRDRKNYFIILRTKTMEAFLDDLDNKDTLLRIQEESRPEPPRTRRLDSDAVLDALEEHFDLDGSSRAKMKEQGCERPQRRDNQTARRIRREYAQIAQTHCHGNEPPPIQQPRGLVYPRKRRG